MSLTNISRRVEIVFWIIWVQMLQQARAVRLAPLALALSACLLALSLTAASAHYLENGSFAVIRRLSLSPQAQVRPATGQHNSLLVLSARADAPSPDLWGVWLVISDGAYQRITLVPVYPLADNQYDDQQLPRQFALDEQGLPAPAFRQALQAQGLWWDHTLMLDQATLAALVELVGGINLQNDKLRGAEAAAYLAEQSANGDVALLRQAQVLQALCNAATPLWAADAQVITGLLHNFGRPDLSPAQQQAGWRAVAAAGEPKCEFPTILGR